MRLILDEGVPRQLARHLMGHDVTTVPEAGWSGIKNGVLLGLIERDGYGAFLSCDQNIPAQQSHLERRPFATLLLTTNHWPTMELHVSKIAEALNYCEPGQVEKIDCGTFVPRKFRPRLLQP